MLDKNEAPDECKSVLRGLFTRIDDDLIEVVRTLVNDWNDPNIMPEFVCDVKRGLTYSKEDGKHNLFITAIDGQASCALIAGAQQYINSLDAITWSPFYKSRVCESIIEGLIPKSGQNVTEVIKQLVSDWNDSQFEPNFIEKVTFDNRDGKECIVVTATGPQNSRALVKGAKKYLTAESGIKWFFKRRFQQIQW